MLEAYRTIASALRRLGPISAAVAYGAFIVAVAGTLYFAGKLAIERSAQPVTALLQLGDGSLSASNSIETRAAVLEGDSWMQNLRSSFHERDRNGGRRSNLGAGPATPQPAKWFDLPLSQPTPASRGNGEEDLSRKSSNGRTYRTMCVRLCDGYFFPVSYSTSSNRFDDDQESCEKSCSSPARLYVYKNPGEEPEDMESLKGQPYSKLPTAFQFRKKIDLACKCAPHPWEAAAMERHRRYAQEEARRKPAKQAEAKPGKGLGKETIAASKSQSAGSLRIASEAIAKPARPPVSMQVGAHRIALLNASATTITDAGATSEKPAPRGKRR